MSDASRHRMKLQIPDALGSFRNREFSRQHEASAIRIMMEPFVKQFERAVAVVERRDKERRRLAPHLRDRSVANSAYAIRPYLKEEVSVRA